jgi:hypothetical protein
LKRLVIFFLVISLVFALLPSPSCAGNSPANGVSALSLQTDPRLSVETVVVFNNLETPEPTPSPQTGNGFSDESSAKSQTQDKKKKGVPDATAFVVVGLVVAVVAGFYIAFFGAFGKRTSDS